MREKKKTHGEARIQGFTEGKYKRQHLKKERNTLHDVRRNIEDRNLEIESR